MSTITIHNIEYASEIANLNPFMYKGYFYDKEIKMNYLKSRYYDPDLGRFINADVVVGSVGQTMGMNLYGYCKCNPINLVDEDGNWPSWATKVCIGLGVIAVCALLTVACIATGGAACVATSMLVGAIKGALIGAVTGAISGAIVGAITEGIRTGTWEGAWKGAVEGAIEGAADGFMWGAIGGAISGALNPKFCFVAGTLVMTKQGLKAIEDIQVGDQVLSYNDNLEIFEYKDVVEVYNNKTIELCHIHTENEEIVCTPNHSILTSEGWKLANELTTKDNIKTSNGYVQVKSIEIEHLKEELHVYNLNVLCYHTYVVGNGLFVVHNACNIEGNNHGAVDHRMKMDNVAEKMSKTDEYTIVYKNKKLSTTGIKSSKDLRPDIVGVKKDGGFKIIEIASKSQKSGKGYTKLKKKVDEMKEIAGVVVELIEYGG